MKCSYTFVIGNTLFASPYSSSDDYLADAKIILTSDSVDLKRLARLLQEYMFYRDALLQDKYAGMYPAYRLYLAKRKSSFAYRLTKMLGLNAVDLVNKMLYD